MNSRLLSCVGVLTCLLSIGTAFAQDRSTVDLGAYDKSSPVQIAETGDWLRARWPIGAGKIGVLDLDLRKSEPLIRGIGIINAEKPLPILVRVDPAVVVTVGTRDLSIQQWMVFFDKVPTRPYEAYSMSLARDTMKVVTEAGRTSIVISGATAGPFSGEYRFTFYPGSPLVHAEAILKTDRPATAMLFDAGLVARSNDDDPSWANIVYTNNDLHDVTVSSKVAAGPATRVQVRNRLIGAEGASGGHVMIVPHPHQYFYPLDFCDNLGSAWVGRGWREKLEGSGFGVCQSIEGDRRYVPWVNAPPGTKQEMGVFYLLDDGSRADAFQRALAYTRDDRFKPLEGFKTFTSHYHVEMTIERLRELERRKKDGKPDAHAKPEFVDVFKQMGVDIAHLAEFHLGEGDLKIASRLDRLKLMHEECARWSDQSFLLLPGEEPNVHLGGHWLSFFPKPVYWTLDREKEQPFSEDDPSLGKVYHVGNAADVLKLMEEESGLMWTAHPRVKGSQGFPDVYRQTDYFKSDHFLGGAWKAMPADYSIHKLGTRVLDLLDDMSNWGDRKQALGEVDVFAIDRHSELYAHMNVNYLKLDALPRFADGWQPVLDALRGGKFFTTTGEVLITSFTVDGKSSGEVIAAPDQPAKLHVELENTFPLDYVEIVSGDGASMSRQVVRVDDISSFSRQAIDVPVDLRGKKWIRFEAWDIARNGAFTQPVWIGEAGR